MIVYQHGKFKVIVHTALSCQVFWYIHDSMFFFISEDT